MDTEEQTPNDEQASIIIKKMLDIEVFPNLSQQVIMTTEDRLRICLTKNLKKAEKKHEWVTPLGILIAVITAFTTASFRDFVLSAKVWEAIFIITGIISFVWLIISLRHAFVKMDLEEIIIEIKTNQKSSNSR